LYACFLPSNHKIRIKTIFNLIIKRACARVEKIRQPFIIREDGRKAVLADVLCDPSTPEASDLLMWRIDNDVLKPLALKAYQKMAGIIESLYPAEQ